MMQCVCSLVRARILLCACLLVRVRVLRCSCSYMRQKVPLRAGLLVRVCSLACSCFLACVCVLPCIDIFMCACVLLCAYLLGCTCGRLRTTSLHLPVRVGWLQYPGPECLRSVDMSDFRILGPQHPQIDTDIKHPVFFLNGIGLSVWSNSRSHELTGSGTLGSELSFGLGPSGLLSMVVHSESQRPGNSHRSNKKNTFQNKDEIAFRMIGAAPDRRLAFRYRD